MSPSDPAAPSAFPELRFRWPWRPHQQRLLDSVDEHLSDDRLHVVAAPGAGKTTLGLEIFRRLGRPALVLAPTVTIRDQWLERLLDFLPEESPRPSWSSSSLDAPALLTVTTYQALHMRSRAESLDRTLEEDGAPEPDDEALDEEEVEALIPLLAGANIGTIVLDEAHHLKQEWWRVLSRVVEGLGDVTLVSLTATPPFDATGAEWRRYEELCGPIDAQISVPELVRAQTLCPHQDFVYVVASSDEAARSAAEHDRAVEVLIGDLAYGSSFLDRLAGHPWIADSEIDVTAVLERPEVAVALLVLLRSAGVDVPGPLPELLGVAPSELPLPARRWWQVALHEYLFGTDWPEEKDAYRVDLTARLRKEGLLWRRQLRIEAAHPVETALAMSASKIKACLDVHAVERIVREDTLRQVFLTDYIRDQDGLLWERTPDESLGAWPLFRALVLAAGERGFGEGPGFGLITGRLALVHREHLPQFRRALGEDEARLVEGPMRDRADWTRLEGVSSGALVRAFTGLLTAGDLQVLVGTRGLLGEGWDAPVVNSIVLASYVGAFVSTNQMRGRALRKSPTEPNKVASVWHLASVAPGTESGLADVRALEQRFRTFVGLSTDGERIESGMERLDLPPTDGTTPMETLQHDAGERLRRLPGIRRGWERAIDLDNSRQVIPSVRYRSPPTLRPVLFAQTMRRVLYQTGAAGLVALGQGMPGLFGSDGLSGLGTGLTMLGAGAFVAMLPGLVRSLRLTWRHLPVDGSVFQIGRAVLDALRHWDLVRVEGKSHEVGVERGRDGRISVALLGGSFYEQSMFADAMGEVLGPILNPRYIITRPGTGMFSGRKDHHAVPTLLGRDRERAQAFMDAWARHVGPGELVYTRREGGREALLTARARSFTTAFVDPSERVDRWQ